MQIMLICTTGNVVNNFRRDLINMLIDKGHEVFVVADFSKISPENSGYTAINIGLNNRSKNVVSGLKYYSDIKKIVKQYRPDVVITFMIKPNTFGARAALKIKGVKVFSMIEGMGIVYTYNTFKYRAIRLITNCLYRHNMKKLNGLFCLNQNDADYFINKKFIGKEKVHVIPGIGLDTDKYKFTPISNYNRVIMVARLLKEKGVDDFCRAAEIVKKDLPDTEFILFGKEEEETRAVVNDYTKRGIISYRGVTNNVAEEMEKSTIFVLPSYYREGASRVIMEAMSCGRPVISCDTIGCNHLVQNGETGFLVPVKDALALSRAILQLLGNREAIIKMGEKARNYAVINFDSKNINEKMIAIISAR